MSVPAVDNHLKAHQVSYVARDGSWFRVVVVVLLLAVLLASLCLSNKMENHNV